MLEAFNEQYETKLPHNIALVTGCGNKKITAIIRSGSCATLREYLSANSNIANEGYRGGYEHVPPLCTAVLEDDFAAVEILIEYGAQVNLRCEGVNIFGLKYSSTALHVAIHLRDTIMAKVLVEQGAEVNSQELPSGYTPLHLAISYGMVGLVQYLMKDYSANPCIPGSDDLWNYPLHKATLKMNLSVMRLLLEDPRSNPNVADNVDGMTALHIAVIEQNIGAVKMIVQHKGDPNVQLKTGHTPLDLASLPSSNREIVRYLKSVGGRRNKKESYRQWIFLDLQPKLLKVALDSGIDVNCRLFMGKTMLHRCIELVDWEALVFLLAQGADANAADHHGRTPLHYMPEWDTDWHQLLLDHGADIYAKDHFGRMPLHCAIIDKNPSICKILVAKGPEALSVAWAQGLPLTCAITERDLATVQALLEAGADVNQTAPFEKCGHFSALCSACSMNAPRILQLLIDSGANVNVPMFDSNGPVFPILLIPRATEPYLESLTIMMNAGAFFDVDFSASTDPKKPSRETVSLDCIIMNSGMVDELRLYRDCVQLFRAIRLKNVTEVEALVARGALVNCCSITFDTPLIFASYIGSLPIVKFLLEKGAKMYLPSMKRSSPLHYAAKYDRRDVAVHLIKNGARITYLCHGLTALGVAMMKGHVEMVRILVFVGKYLLETGTQAIRPMPNYNTDPVVMKILAEMKDKRPLKGLMKALFAE